MASSQKTRSQATKDRIQEIRNRVFQEVSDAPDQEIEEIEIEAKDVPAGADLSVVDTAENAVPVQEPITEVSETDATATSSTVEVAEDEPGTKNVPDEKLKHQEIQDFEKIKIQMAEEINAEFALLTKQTDERLSNFETKIPDIEKGSKVRDELLHDIDLMISQKVNEQKNKIDSVIEKLEMSFASANDLVEMQESLEKSLDLGLKSNLAAGDEVGRAVKEDFASLVDNFKASNEQVDKKLKDNTDLLSSVESRVTNSLKTVEEFSNSVREDIDPILNKISISNKKIDTKFQNNTEEFLNLQNAIDHQQKSFAADLNRKLTNTDSKISTLSTDTEKRSSELNSFLIKKNNDLDKAINQKIKYNSGEMEKKLLALEESVNRGINSTTETSETLKKDLDNRLKDNSGKLENLNVLIQQAIIAFETKLAASNEKTAIENQKNIADRLLSLKRTLEAQQKFFSDSFSEKLKTNNDPIVNKLEQLDKKFGTKVTAIEAQQKALPDSFSEKLKTNNASLINELGKLDKKLGTKVSAIEAQQKALPDSFSEKLKTNNDSLINELGKLDKKLETKVSSISSSLEKHLSSALSRQEKTIESLTQEIKLLKENFGVEVSEVKSLLERQKTNLFDQIANSSAEFNKKMQSQTEHTESKFGIVNQKLIQNAVEVDKTIEIQATNNNKSFNLLKQEFKDQTNEQNIDLNRKIDRHVIEFTKFKKDNGVALTSLNGNIEEKLDAVSLTLEENQKNHQNQLDKLQSVVTTNGLKSSENLKKEIDKISSNNHANNNKLSTEFATLINECKNTISQKTGMLEVESFFKNEMDKKLDIFSNRMGDHFQTIHKNIKTVEEMILKEEDLTELFKNYTLNVSIGD